MTTTVRPRRPTTSGAPAISTVTAAPAHLTIDAVCIPLTTASVRAPPTTIGPTPTTGSIPRLPIITMGVVITATGGLTIGPAQA